MSSKNHISPLLATISIVARILLFLTLLGTHHHNWAVAASNNPIKTVVVLVMENRSFDHMLGWMKKLNPEINGVDGSESNPVSTSDPKSRRVYFGDKSHYVDPDPGHSFQAIREQIFGSNDSSKKPAPMNGFAQQALSMDSNMPDQVMNGFQPDMVAVYKTLVSEFAVCDRWFASVPASTQPNRLYVHSATSHGATSNIASLLAKGYPQRTIFENLDDAGINFGIYYQNIPATLFYLNLRKLKYVGKFHPYDITFKNHAKSGKLPGYVVVEQRYMDSKLQPANDDHPSHDVYQGQMFVKEVYETLRASPQWNQTLLVITYDEHGGFFDHVPTPVSGVPSPDGIVGEPFDFKFDRLGVRVPTIMISPWIQKGTANDHPSYDAYQGHMFVKEVYKTLRASPQWNQTVLVITYDEHGGFFDHVPTPVSGVPSPDGIVGEPFDFKFDRLSVRVPTIIISPWIKKGIVVHGPNGSPFPTSEYEHSSIAATVKKIFNLPSPFLTKRDAWAGTFEHILQTRKEPRTDCPEKLPTPTKIRKGEANEDANISEFQQELVQLAAVLKGDHLLTSYPEKIGKGMTVRQGKAYMEDAVKHFFEAGFAAKKIGVDEEQIVQMRPSLTTRSSTNLHP